MDRLTDAPPSLSGEYQMLLACARSRMDDRHARIIQELARGALDWKALLALARRHSLFPMLYRQLAAVAPRAVPPESLDRLKELYQGNAARNLFLLGELERVFRSLAEAGILAMPYKGPALAIAGYGDLSLRRFVDLDIIVQRNDVERAIATLTHLGYRLDPTVTDAQLEFLIRTQHDLVFKRDEGRLIVELHWEIASPRFATELAAENLWRNATMQPIGASEMLTLAPEDMLLSLCVHGTKHLWERLAWVCDIAEWIAAHPALQWPELLARAERNGQQRMLFVGLRLAAELLDASLPEAVGTAIDADRTITRLAARAKAVIFGEPPRPPGMISALRFNLLIRPGWNARWNYLRHLLTPTEADVRAIRVLRALQFVYYIVRPFRLLSKKEHLH
ncbi:MAG TPA: nucleotidyltransferase family protein [Thermoanaerobaculia bacterium]|nr:nucleotidyltransferase family protein [Thermoanaerobaculia bacterium]